MTPWILSPNRLGENFNMFDTSARTLKILAAVVWYGGAISLIFKGGVLLTEAFVLQPDNGWPWGVVVIGVVLGSLKARYLFSGVCEKNLQRTQSLEQPKIWQFFRKRFFFSLLAMIVLGISLSRGAHQHYAFLLCVAALDLSIGVALMGSSYMFWKR
jgi:hypothetical protein